jgi:hypothetical protein
MDFSIFGTHTASNHSQHIRAASILRDERGASRRLPSTNTGRASILDPKTN